MSSGMRDKSSQSSTLYDAGHDIEDTGWLALQLALTRPRIYRFVERQVEELKRHYIKYNRYESHKRIRKDKEDTDGEDDRAPV